MKSRKFIENLVLNGSPAEKRELYGFDKNTAEKIVLKKFKIFARGEYSRYFEDSAAPFHDEMVLNMIRSYYGEFPDDITKKNFANVAGRGTAKTSLAKLFINFVLLNDRSSYRKYVKVLTRDGKNSKQIVTDIYNLMLEVRYIYGDMFEAEGEKKREETMSSFTMKSARKLTAGTVGQVQRGHVQDAYRPDWVIFDDIEDRDSIRSSVITEAVINRVEEAIDGLSKNGSYLLLGNYISDQGSIEWFMAKPNVFTLITPIAGSDLAPTWPSRDKKEDIVNLKANAKDFWGEYMCDPSKSVNKFFALDLVQKDIERAIQPLSTSAGVKYWRLYVPNHRYGAGSDHSEGIGEDSNTLSVFDFSSGELVATYANNLIAPDLSAHEFARVCGEYGNCLYAPETNNKCGGTALTTLKHIGYPNIYQQRQVNKHKDKRKPDLGWNSNGSSKYIMFNDFRTDYNDGKIRIYDVNVLKEMKAYTNSDLAESNVGLITKHFDLLTSTIIAWQMHKYAQVKSSKKSYKSNYENYINA